MSATADDLRQLISRSTRVAGDVLRKSGRDLTGLASCGAVVVGFGLIYLPLGFIVAGCMGLTLLHLTTPSAGPGA